MRILLSISIILIGFYSYAGVIVLDQNGQGDYVTFADAVDNSTVGDTIYVVGSSASYGNISLNSSRTIIGNGYFGQSLGYNASATFGTVTINAGASNSIFVGLTLGTIIFNESTLSLISCNLYGSSTIGASITDVLYEKCYFTAPLTVQGSGVIIQNSIFNYISAGNALTVSGGVEAYLDYNTFYDGNLSLDTALVSNCILNTSKVSQTPAIVVDGEFGNKVDSEPNLLFDTSFGNDGFLLQVGSPALTSSESGEESGAFGFPVEQDDFAYVLSGLPSIPWITGLDYASSSNSSTNLDIRIKAEASENINQIDVNVFYDGSYIETQSFNAFTPFPSIDEVISLNTSLYGTDLHSFSIEVTSESGLKSIHASGSFLQEEIVTDGANITDLEYFIGNDPGAGFGVPIVNSPSPFVSIIENLDFSGLSEGFHTIYLRAKDQTGKWGPYSSTTVYVESTIGTGDVVQVEEVEYFIDTDPGAGLGTSIAISQGVEVSTLESLDLGSLTPGFHTIYLRGKLLNGVWGPYSSTTVYVESTIGVNDLVVIDQLEYFIDTDPGAGLATPIAASSSSEISLVENIDLSSLPTGFHTLYLRGKLENGTWGPYTSQSVYIESVAQGVDEQIVAVEYFFDTDPGVGLGETVSASLPAISLNETVSLNTSGLSTGTHTVSFRAKEESGAWSHYQTQEIEVLAGTLVESVANGNWDDPGIWSTSTVPTSIDSVSIRNVVTLNVPTDTVLALTLASGGTLDLNANDIHVRGRFTSQSGSTYIPGGGSLFIDGGSQTYSNEGNITHGNLIFGGSGTKTIINLNTDNIAVEDSLHIELGVSLDFSESIVLSLLGTADFVSEGTISSSSKWSLYLIGTSHIVDGGDFENVTFQSAATLNINSDFNYDQDFNTGTLGSVINLGSNEINLGNTWSVTLNDVFNFNVGGRLRAEKSVVFSMEVDVPLIIVDANSGTFTSNGNLTFGTDQLLNIEAGTVNLNSASFSGSGGISLSGGSLNVTNSALTFGNGSFISNNGGIITVLGSSTIAGATTADAYTFVQSAGSLTLDGTSISEVGGLGLSLLGGTVSMTDVSFTNGLGVSYITFDTGFNGSVYEGIFFESGPTFNVSINDDIDQVITFDQYGGSFGGPDFDNPGTAGTINWTNPQGLGSITVNTPSGGEELTVGEAYEITWSTENIAGSDLIEINLSTDGGGTYTFISDGTFDTYNGSFSWTVPDLVGTENVIQIVNTTQGISDESDEFFSIVEAQGSISVISPNGGENLTVDQVFSILWTEDGIEPSDLIEISLSRDGGETFELLVDGAFESFNGEFDWTVSGPNGSNNIIEVHNTTLGISDISDGTFVITGGDIATPVAVSATNVTATSFEANWNHPGSESYFVDVSIESDFSSFVDGLEQVEVFDQFLVVEGLDFTQSYYYRVTANDDGTLSDPSNIVSVKTGIDQETISDSTALVQIYNSLGGSDWTTTVNWETARLREWDRVLLDNTQTRVEDVDISGLGSVGDMPNPFTGDAVGGLSAMLEMDVSNNEITGLMDFSGTSITNLNVSGNNLQFDDLEPIVGITTLDYSNQSSLPFNETVEGVDSILVNHTEDFLLSTNVGGSQNSYQWQRNGSAIASGEDYAITGANANILSIDYDNMGEFSVAVSNALVPGLTINIDPQLVLAIADLNISVLGTDGMPISENLTNAYLLEAFRRAKGFDTLVSVSNVSSEFSFPDLVLGNYLAAVDSDPEKYIATYFGDEFLWDEADTIFFRNSGAQEINIQVIPPPRNPEDQGKVSGTVDEDFPEDEGRIDARRRAARRKCGLRRQRTGGRTGAEDDGFELIAYGETNENGEFEYGQLSEGTYRFFVEYPGIPLDPDAFVQFEVGEAGISQNEFVLAATVTENGIQVELIKSLGVIHRYFKNLQIYPNPSREMLNISYRHLTTDAVRMELHNLAGTMLLSRDLERGYDRDLHVDVSDYEEGIYLLRFYDKESREKNMMTYRIIVRD